MSKTEQLSQRQKNGKAKGQEVKGGQEDTKVEKGRQRKKGRHINGQGERWIERLIVRERGTQCGIYIRLPKDI